MKFSSQSCLSLALLPFVIALPTDFVVKDSITRPERWIQTSSELSQNKSLNLKIGLRQPRLLDLQSQLEAFYDPAKVQASTQKFEAQEIADFLQPEKADYDKVDKWLKQNGVEVNEDDNDKLGGWIAVRIDIGKAESMFDANFQEFHNVLDGRYRIRTLKYSLPRDLHGSIDTVAGMTGFHSLQPHVSTVKQKSVPQGWTPQAVASDSSTSAQLQPSAPASCNTSATTVQCIRELYGTVNYEPTARKENTVAVGSFLEMYASYQDFSEFTKSQRKDAYAANFTFGFVSVNGGLNDQSKPGIEANLDTQLLAGMGFPIPLTDYSTAGRPPFIADNTGSENESEPYQEFLSHLLGLPDSEMPSVVTMSYGDSEETVPQDYARKVCDQISALVARRVTVLSSSGDFGVGRGGANKSCASNGNGPVKAGVERFRPEFPCTCPWITCVGGTQNFAPEVAVSDEYYPGFFSGGGFSDYFKVAQWQVNATTDYLAKIGPKNEGLFDPLGRGIPDLAAQGSNIVTRQDGVFRLIYGTSAAAPIWASIVSQLNDARSAKGLPNLGYLNPLIYSKWAGTTALNDVVSGNSAGCNTSGFSAQQGWDAVTGYGTPNFLELVKTVT